MNPLDRLFTQELKVINMGLEAFQKDLTDQGVEAIQMNWRPRAGGNKRMIELLDRLRE